MELPRRLPMAIYLALALSPLPLVLVHVWGPRFALNFTASMPRGLYWRSPVTTLQRGNMVIACIPHDFAIRALHEGYLHEGPCGGVSSVLKYVAATSGDDVTLTPRGVFVNGSRLAGSTPLASDDRSHILPHVPFRTYHISSKEVWLYSPKPHSFDSRYYGPIPLNDVQAFAYPIITERELYCFFRIGKGFANGCGTRHDFIIYNYG